MRRLSIVVVVMLFGGPAWAIPIGGIEFPDGEISFADVVVSYNPGPDVNFPYDQPEDALGTPDYDGANGAVSLGEAGSLVLGFTDNFLTTSGNATPDLYIFEIGAATEWMNVQISIDNITYVDLGNVLGQPTAIDIDAIAGVVAGALYSFVMISDVGPGQSGPPSGEADIDAVGALSSVPPVTRVPEPGPFSLLCAGLFALAWARRRIGPIRE